jgi:hypothetical protein
MTLVDTPKLRACNPIPFMLLRVSSKGPRTHRSLGDFAFVVRTGSMEWHGFAQHVMVSQLWLLC